MTTCGCTSSICTCHFINGETTIAEGNGRVATPFAVHLNDIPYPRPTGFLSRSTSGDQAITANTDTQLIFDTNELTTVNANFDADTLGTSVTDFTISEAGIYFIGAFAEWSATVTANAARQLWIARNGATDVLARQRLQVTNAFGANVRNILNNVTSLVSLVAGDVLRAYVRSDGEASSVILIDTDSGGSMFNCWPYMYAQWMGRAS